MFGWILGLIVGAAAPIQTSVNNSLREKLKSPYLSSVVSFGTAAIAVAIALLISQHSLAVPLADIAGEPWWIWTGGLFGTLLVICSIVSMPHLGSAQTVMLISLGQVISGLLLDNFGWLGSNIVPINMTRLAGAALVLAGVAAVSISKRNVVGELYADESDNITGDVTLAEDMDELREELFEAEQSSGAWLYRFLAFIAGCGTAIQISINGRLGEVAGNMFGATLISMVIGLTGAVLVCLFIRLFKGRSALIDDSRPDVDGKWWMYTGGLFGFIIVCGNVILAQMLGTGLSVVLNIAGQMIGGIAIDATGFLGIERQNITVRKVAGVVIMLAGIALINGVI